MYHPQSTTERNMQIKPERTEGNTEEIQGVYKTQVGGKNGSPNQRRPPLPHAGAKPQHASYICYQDAHPVLPALIVCRCMLMYANWTVIITPASVFFFFWRSASTKRINHPRTNGPTNNRFCLLNYWMRYLPAAQTRSTSWSGTLMKYAEQYW